VAPDIKLDNLDKERLIAAMANLLDEKDLPLLHNFSIYLMIK
jgi:hypothetical protein